MNPTSSLKLLGLAVISAIGATSPLHAANIWDGGGANANWDTANNWDDNLVPASGADVTFLTENTSGSTILLNGNRTSGLVTFNNTDATSPGATSFSGGVASVWTINTGFVKSGNNVDFTVGSSNLGIQLDADGLYLNNQVGGTFTFNAGFTGASGSVISLNNHTGGTAGTVRIGGNNSNFDGTWLLNRGTLSVDGNGGTALGDAASNTVTFNNTAGQGGNTVTYNTGTAATTTWVNNFVNNNASGSGAELAGITFSGGTNSNGSLALTGTFTSGASQNASARMNLNAGTSNGNGTSEGRILISGDWSGYNKGGASNGITLNERGSIIIQNALALANSAVGYNIASTQAGVVGSGATGAGLAMSAKLILGDAITMANTVNFSGTGGNMNSFGARHASGTAILSGQLSNDDADGANVFSQNTGATLRLTGQVSSLDATRALNINRSYTFNDGTGAATANPTGTVEFARATGVSYTGTVTVHAGTLLVNNTSGNGTGSGALTVNSGAILGGNGTIGAATTISGSLRPGNSIGTLTVANDVTWNSNDSWVFELGTAGATMLTSGTSDFLNITGGTSDFLKGTGTTFTFDFANGGQVGWYKLVDWAGTTTFSVGDFAATNLASGLTGNFTLDAGTSALYLNVIPEPSTWALFGAGLAALAVYRRRKTNRQS